MFERKVFKTMKTLDYLYEEYLRPVFEAMVDLVEFILTRLLTFFLLILFPIWVIPYLIIKKRKGGGE